MNNSNNFKIVERKERKGMEWNRKAGQFFNISIIVFPIHFHRRLGGIECNSSNAFSFVSKKSSNLIGSNSCLLP